MKELNGTIRIITFGDVLIIPYIGNDTMTIVEVRMRK